MENIKVNYNKENIKMAISKGWESLYFSDNDMNFISIENTEYFLELRTSGAVKVILDEPYEVLVNKDEDRIRELLDDGVLDIDCAIMNNWFELSYCKKRKFENEEDSFIGVEVLETQVMEACPKTTNELVCFMIEEFDRFVSEESICLRKDMLPLLNECYGNAIVQFNKDSKRMIGEWDEEMNPEFTIEQIESELERVNGLDFSIKLLNNRKRLLPNSILECIEEKIEELSRDNWFVSSENLILSLEGGIEDGK